MTAIIGPIMGTPDDDRRRFLQSMDTRIPRVEPLFRRHQMPVSIIELPKRQREGSITDEQVAEVFDALAELGDREAVVIAEGLAKDTTARNRATAMAHRFAELYTDNDEEDTDFYLRAHSIKVGDTYTAAVSVRPTADEPADDAA